MTMSYNENTYKRAEVFRIIIGVLSVLSAIFYALLSQRNIVDFITSPLLLYNDVNMILEFIFDVVPIILAYISILIFTVYIWFVYGKMKSNLIALPLILQSVSFMLHLLYYVQNFKYLILYQQFSMDFISCSILFILYALLSFGSFKLFKRIILCKVVAVIALIVEIVLSIMLLIEYDFQYDFGSIIMIILNKLFPILLVMYFFACPINYKKNKQTVYYNLQEQKEII